MSNLKQKQIFTIEILSFYKPENLNIKIPIISSLEQTAIFAQMIAASLPFSVNTQPKSTPQMFGTVFKYVVYLCGAVVPDLESVTRQHKGGRVPAAAVDVAYQYCIRYIHSRCHDDIDKVSCLPHVHCVCTSVM